MQLRRTFVAAAVLAGFALSCQALLGIRDADFEVDEGGSSDSGEDAATDAGASCSVPLPERRPGGGSGKPYFFAFDSIRITGTPEMMDGGGIKKVDGFDLDRSCTCAPNVPGRETRASCEQPDGAPHNKQCDYDGGIDNALLALVVGYPTDTLAEANKGVEKEFACGRQNLVFILQEYNGLADDDFVLLYGAPSFGIREPHAVEPNPDRCSPTFEAKNDGTDRWFVDSKLVDETGKARKTSFKGYVSNYRLVIDGREPDQPSETLAVVGLSNPPIGLFSPVLVATLEPRDGGLAVTDGVMAGRTDVKKTLSSLGELPSQAKPGMRRCAESSWVLVQAGICASRDMMLDPRADFTGATCDSLSIVARFTAVPVLVQNGDPPAPTELDAAACDPALLECP
jgi:hypothetical protein